MTTYSKDQIRNLDEAELRREIIIPLLIAMGFEDVEEYHGTGEETEMLFGMELPVGRVEYSYRVRIVDEEALRDQLRASTSATPIEVKLAKAGETAKVTYLDWPPHTSESTVNLSLIAAREEKGHGI